MSLQNVSWDDFNDNGEYYSTDYDIINEGYGEPISDTGGFFNDLTTAGWDFLSIYGQAKAIDAQFDNPPYPQAEPALYEKNDHGTYLAGKPTGEPFAGISNKTALGIGAFLLVAIATVAIVTD